MSSCLPRIQLTPYAFNPYASKFGQFIQIILPYVTSDHHLKMNFLISDIRYSQKV